MRDYSVVSPRFWIGATGKALRGNAPAQVLALYLMTSPHANMIGVFHCPLIYVAHETGLGMEGASKALQSLIEAGFCAYEEATETVFVHRMAAFQIGDQLEPQDKRCKGVEREWKNIASPKLQQAFFAMYSGAFHLPKPEGRGKGHGSPFKAPSKPGTGTGTGTGTGSNTPQPPEGGFDAFWSAYPKKVGKDAAQKAFEKRKPDEELLSKMLSAVAVQAASEQWRKDGGQFIPNPATWLNQARWEDSGVALVAGGTGPKRDSDEYAALHKSAGWWRDAGFPTIWDAMASKCWHDNAHEFRDGKRVEVAA